MPATPVPADLADHLALALTPGLGPKLTAAVLAHFGTAAAAPAATARQLEAVPLIGAKLAGKIADGLRAADVDADQRAEIARMRRMLAAARR